MIDFTGPSLAIRCKEEWALAFGAMISGVVFGGQAFVVIGWSFPEVTSNQSKLTFVHSNFHLPS